jgi:uncharacterized membrane protein
VTRSRSLSPPAYRLARFALLVLLAAAVWRGPAHVQTAGPSIVHAVLFTNPACTFCRQIVDDDLPPAIRDFGAQLELLRVDVNSAEGKALYEAALQAFDIPRGVPLILIGETSLGGVNIVPKFPGLVQAALASGGLDWPAIPGLPENLAAFQPTPTTPPATPQPLSTPGAQLESGLPVVSAVLFWMDGCPHCHEVIENVLPPLQEKYAAQLDIRMIEVVTLEDVNRLYALGQAYGLPRDQVGVPLLIIGEHLLAGSEQIPAELPGLIEEYLAAGGIAAPDISAYYSAQASITPGLSTGADGFWLAWLVMGLLLATLLYTLAAFGWKPVPTLRSHWSNFALPVLALAGLGVAAYLSYVETQQVPAICGPVGDCNAVQSSAYARLFGVPVGLLGMLGYVLILASWGWQRLRRDRLARLAPPAIFALSLVGVLFSIYLTYLELFVIQAVCLWCLASAVIISLLLLFSLPARLAARPGVAHDPG